MKKLLALLILLPVLFSSQSFAASGCLYPGTLDSFVDKISGDFLTVADLNTRTCAIEKTQLRLNQLFSGISGGQTIKGGTGIAEGLFLQATSGAGVGAEFVKIMGGNNGASSWTTWNQGKLLMSTGTPTGAVAGEIVLANNRAYRWTVGAGTTSANFGITGDTNNHMIFDVAGNANGFFYRFGGTSRMQILTDGTTSGAIILFDGESSTGCTPAANQGCLFIEDNGSGKTRACFKFFTGVKQCFATEP